MDALGRQKREQDGNEAVMLKENWCRAYHTQTAPGAKEGPGQHKASGCLSGCAAPPKCPVLQGANQPAWGF